MDDILDRARSSVTQRAELPGMSLLEHLEELRRRIIHSVIYLVLSGVIFVLQLTISPLAPFLAVFGFFVTAKFLAYNNFDFPLTRRALHFGGKWAWLGKFGAETYGFGSVVALLAFVPGLGLIVPAVAAAGATLLYLELEKS